MTFKETMAKLFSTSEGTYYKWKKEERPIIELLNKYFSQEDLEEFLSTGTIKRLDKESAVDNTDITNILVDDTIFRLRTKLQQKTDGNLLNLITTFVSKGLLTRIVEELSTNKELYTLTNSKDYLIDRIKNENEKFFEYFKKRELINYIENNLSKVECYVLINYHETVMNYPNYIGKKPKL